MESTSQRELIDRIRREKFGIGATKSNPLAGMLHEAIFSLSAELYQKDVHFISELLQNAEDNVYAKGVTPSMELVLTRTDITGVGAPATLIFFNNEVGFQPEHVEALCAVGMSTKKGKRNSGYIGEKEALPMDSRLRREHIDRIRREKFGIGATKSNPLAGKLHEAIVSLSADMYQKDIHFISELLQNAEDNIYAEGGIPSLELVLTRTDITGVGAPATLILFNNEVGFQPEHVEALCAVGMSTKKGKRNSGYIGEKDTMADASGRSAGIPSIGFKSVFLVTRTPYVISNGYRFRFTDEASNEAKIGYVVPEWVEKPTDSDMKWVYGKLKLPQTMIILPLPQDKVEPVREQLKQVAPETLLFLSKLP